MTRSKILIQLLLSVSTGCTLMGCSKSVKTLSEPADPAISGRVASTDVVKATVPEVEISPGNSADATVHITIQNGYHINSNPPTYPYLKQTELEIPPGGGVSVGFITYPDPVMKKFNFAEKPLAVYEGETVLRIMLKADKAATKGARTLPAKLRIQACDDQVCYAPGVLEVEIPLKIK